MVELPEVVDTAGFVETAITAFGGIALVVVGGAIGWQVVKIGKTMIIRGTTGGGDNHSGPRPVDPGGIIGPGGLTPGTSQGTQVASVKKAVPEIGSGL